MAARPASTASGAKSVLEGFDENAYRIKVKWHCLEENSVERVKERQKDSMTWQKNPTTTGCPRTS